MVGAALAMQTAHELDPECVHHQDDLQRLKRYIPNRLADILEVVSFKLSSQECLLECVAPVSLSAAYVTGRISAYCDNVRMEENIVVHVNAVPCRRLTVLAEKLAVVVKQVLSQVMSLTQGVRCRYTHEGRNSVKSQAHAMHDVVTYT